MTLAKGRRRVSSDARDSRRKRARPGRARRTPAGTRMQPSSMAPTALMRIAPAAGTARRFKRIPASETSPAEYRVTGSVDKSTEKDSSMLLLIFLRMADGRRCLCREKIFSSFSREGQTQPAPAAAVNDSRKPVSNRQAGLSRSSRMAASDRADSIS